MCDLEYDALWLSDDSRRVHADGSGLHTAIAFDGSLIMKRRDLVIAASSSLALPAQAIRRRGVHTELFKPKAAKVAAVPTQILRVQTPMTNLTETGNAVAGWNYQHAGGGDVGGIL